MKATVPIWILLLFRFLPFAMPLTTVPTGEPSRSPVGKPTNQPSNQPSGIPSRQPSRYFYKISLLKTYFAHTLSLIIVLKSTVETTIKMSNYAANSGTF